MSGPIYTLSTYNQDIYGTVSGFAEILSFRTSSDNATFMDNNTPVIATITGETINTGSPDALAVCSVLGSALDGQWMLNPDLDIGGATFTTVTLRKRALAGSTIFTPVERLIIHGGINLYIFENLTYRNLSLSYRYV